MTVSLLAAWIHLVAGVLLVGCVLYWCVMALGVPGDPGIGEGRSLLERVRSGYWPPAGAPRALRVPFGWLGWIFLGVLLVTGGLMLIRRGFTVGALLSGAVLEARYGRVLAAKLGLVLLLALGLGTAAVRPRRSLAILNLVLAVGALVATALLRR